MTHKIKTRITFDYENDRRGSNEKLTQIICAARRGTGIDVFGFLNENHPLLFDLLMKSVIVIDECEYEAPKPSADKETVQTMKTILGKRSNHPVLRDMAALFADEPFEASGRYRNTIYFPNHKAFARADGMKPEHISDMLTLDWCDKIILFPYFPLDGKSAYYELTLAVPKDNFVDFLRQVDERKLEKMNEEINQAVKQSIEGYHRATLRLENKSDWKTVEQISYRAFLNAEHAGGDEALLAQKLRSRATFVPELDYVAEVDGKSSGTSCTRGVKS